MRRTVTCFGEEVDERVCLAALEELHQLGAAVQTEVVDAKSSLAPHGGVQQGTLGNTDTGLQRQQMTCL